MSDELLELAQQIALADDFISGYPKRGMELVRTACGEEVTSDNAYELVEQLCLRIDATEKRFKVLFEAAEKAASAPGIDWLEEQLELGRTLIDLLVETKTPGG